MSPSTAATPQSGPFTGAKQIGAALFLSTRTVEAHMRSIFDKLGVSSRTEAVTYAVRHHWIQLSDAD